MLPNFGTYGPAVVIGAMINKGGIGYGMSRYGWIADYSDAQSFLFLLESGNVGLNVGGYRNPEFDTLMTRAAAEPDDAGDGRTSVTGSPSNRNPPGLNRNVRVAPLRSRSVTPRASTATTSPQKPLARSSTTRPGVAGTSRYAGRRRCCSNSSRMSRVIGCQPYAPTTPCE